MCVGKNQLSLKAKDREKTSANLLVLRGARVTSKEKKNRCDDQTVSYIDRFIRSLNKGCRELRTDYKTSAKMFVAKKKAQALETTVGGINSGQVQSCQRYFYLMILCRRTIDFGALDAVS